MSLTKTYFNAIEDPFDFIPKEAPHPHTDEDLKWAIDVAVKMNREPLLRESKSVYFKRLKATAFLFLETLNQMQNDTRSLDKD